MRIVDLKTFRELPNGTTVYCKYSSMGNFCDLEIKEETWDHDFISTKLVGEFDTNDTGEFVDLFTELEKGIDEKPLSFDESCRDGLFDKDQLFAIFSPDDVKGLAERLLKTLED